ncbi:phosphotransferase [uncultured Ilyobacter sp.]|uniref:phosphotransferase n=1 Tax=uncultured Ilyobacter sp. TaxID=544433 RepID=UPI0029C6FF72|nr:phosphotransferase [uncultured Ilyobacter sp.]
MPKLEGEIYKYIKDGNLKGILDIGKNFKVHFLAQGEYNKNYVLEDSNKKYVFRLNTGSQIGISNQIEYEYRALKRLEESGYTPKVHYVDGGKKNLEYGVLIMDYLEGKPLNYRKDLSTAAEIFSGIHSLEVRRDDFDYLITENYIFSDRLKEAEDLLKKIWTSPLVDKKTKVFFEKYLSWCKGNAFMEKYFIENPWKAINNTEVNSHNFIIGPEKSYLIDWEKPVISDPCQDITQFLAPTTTLWKADTLLTENEIEYFYSAYEEKNPDKDIRERVRMYTPYLYLRALSWCAYAYIEYQDPEKAIKNQDTYKKICKYLEIDFMKKLLKEWVG